VPCHVREPVEEQPISLKKLIGGEGVEKGEKKREGRIFQKKKERFYFREGGGSLQYRSEIKNDPPDRKKSRRKEVLTRDKSHTQ